MCVAPAQRFSRSVVCDGLVCSFDLGSEPHPVSRYADSISETTTENCGP